jgi:hypothetical protein
MRSGVVGGLHTCSSPLTPQVLPRLVYWEDMRPTRRQVLPNTLRHEVPTGSTLSMALQSEDWAQSLEAAVEPKISELATRPYPYPPRTKLREMPMWLSDTTTPRASKLDS